MGGHKNKKKFIDKKNAVKFYLVHRSQKDPLFLDENAGEHVLLPAEPIKNKKIAQLLEELNEKKEETPDEIEKRRLEQHKYGIYFDDDYNYLQHLKEPSSTYDVHAERVEFVDDEDEIVDDKIEDEGEKERVKPKLQLPSSVFASEYEEEVGYFNQGAPDSDPKVNWDPEIVEILDEESKFNYEDPNNQLDDDFFVKANADKLVGIVEDDDDDQYTDIDSDEEEEDEEDDNSNYNEGRGSEENESLNKFETKTQFTNYSMTSSVIRRNEKLKYLDEHFEKLYAQYDNEQIGALDTEDIDGYRDVSNVVIQKALEDFKKQTTKLKYETDENNNNSESKKLDVVKEDAESDEEDDDEDSDDDDDEEEEEEYEYIWVKEKVENPVDCESVLSLISNKSNQPIVIKKDEDLKNNYPIRLSKRTGLPMNTLKDKPISKHQMEKVDYKITKVVPELPIRDKNETKEEKKQRKQAIKEHRRIRRMEKKINKLAFKEEKLKQQNQIGNINSRIVQIKLS